MGMVCSSSQGFCDLEEVHQKWVFESLPYLKSWTWALKPCVKEPLRSSWGFVGGNVTASEEVLKALALEQWHWDCCCSPSLMGGSGPSHPGARRCFFAQAELHNLSCTSWSELFFSSAALEWNEGKFKLTPLFCWNTCQVLCSSTEVQIPVWKKAKVVGR